MAEKVNYYLEVKRHGEWTTVGQYVTAAAARQIEAEYRQRGQIVRVMKEGNNGLVRAW